MTSTLRGGESAFTAKRSLRPACLLRGLFLHVVTLLFLLPCLGNATGVPVRSLRGLASTPLNRWNWPRRSPLAPTRDVAPAGGAGSTKTANTSDKQDSGSASATSIQLRPVQLATKVPRNTIITVAS
ncbi:unnamed protein product [Amoebophrya sp. A25]|nr:unnamed protein product [Amoebophrya sp. A25]|eukprot:GSA25T00027452001.1